MNNFNCLYMKDKKLIRLLVQYQIEQKKNGGKNSKIDNRFKGLKALKLNKYI